MSDLPQISLNLMKKRRRRSQFRLRRRRYIHPNDVQGVSQDQHRGDEEAPRQKAPEKQSGVSQEEVSALRQAYEVRLKDASGRVNKAESMAADLTRELDAVRQSLKQSEDRFDVAKKTVEDSRVQVLRARSDMESQRKRIQREREELKELAGEEFMRQMLPIIDNMAIALRSCSGETEPSKLTQGLLMIQRELSSTMENFGLKPIDAVGQPFDPRFHDAASTARIPEKPDGIVLEQLRPGYLYKTKILRPTMVVVNKLHDTPVTRSSENPATESGDSSQGTAMETPNTPSGTEERVITPRALRTITGKPVAPPPVRPLESDRKGSGMDKTPFKDVSDLTDTQF
ncbi:MAG: nucleotide exchange factor GrpE [Candidatus Sumerlaeia bacterium]|nr:nucleotide exchange factor GrpE [Candidatus Sumerlaeia bacterium]